MTLLYKGLKTLAVGGILSFIAAAPFFVSWILYRQWPSPTARMRTAIYMAGLVDLAGVLLTAVALLTLL